MAYGGFVFLLLALCVTGFPLAPVFAENAQKLPVLQGRATGPPVQAFSAPPPPGGGFKSWLQRHSALYLALAERLSAFRLKRGGSNPLLARLLATSPEEWNATDRLLEMFVDQCRSAGAVPVLAYFPMDVEVLAADAHQATFVAGRLAATIDRLGAVRVDLLGALRRQREQNLYMDDVHLTRTGNEIVAAALVATIRTVEGSQAR